MNANSQLERLNQNITACVKCPRLVQYRERVAENPPLRYRGQKYWARPLPGFGDEMAKIHVVGLAPAAQGGNRTGRIFTGDRSGDWLYSTLYAVGLANQDYSVSKEDGLQIYGIYVSAAVRCAPPDNKPTVQEFVNCRPYLEREFDLLNEVRVIVALGSIAYNSIKRVMKRDPSLKKFRFPMFGHGVQCILPDRRSIVCSYHPSQQNTFTGKLTREMFLSVFQTAKELAGL